MLLPRGSAHLTVSPAGHSQALMHTCQPGLQDHVSQQADHGVQAPRIGRHGVHGGVSAKERQGQAPRSRQVHTSPRRQAAHSADPSSHLPGKCPTGGSRSPARPHIGKGHRSAGWTRATEGPSTVSLSLPRLSVPMNQPVNVGTSRAGDGSGTKSGSSASSQHGTVCPDGTLSLETGQSQRGDCVGGTRMPRGECEPARGTWPLGPPPRGPTGTKPDQRGLPDQEFPGDVEEVWGGNSEDLTVGHELACR